MLCKMKIFLVILFCSSLSSQRVLGFGISAGAINMKRRSTSLSVWGRTDEEDKLSSSWPSHIGQTIQRALAVVTVAATVWTGGLTQLPPTALAAQDPNQIVACLFQKCSKPLGQCVLNPKCLANVVCLNTCGDDINCQIKCGDLFENSVVGDFNKCVVSDMACIQQKQDEGDYPIPTKVVSKFDTSFFNGRLYITAGQNPLFDIFPCQVHFFTETEPGKFFGKLNWRVTEPDGEFFTRDALQEFVQDPKNPAHLINDENEYLHYKDDWYIIDYDSTGPEPFAFVYYRGSNDAWDGYGGAVVYTRAAQLPESLRPRLREAAAAVGFDFDRDFVVTDNTCPAEQSLGEKQLLREQFAGKVLLQTENQLQAATVRLRGNAVNSVKAQKLFFGGGQETAQKAFAELERSQAEFERESTSAKQ